VASRQRKSRNRVVLSMFREDLERVWVNCKIISQTAYSQFIDKNMGTVFGVLGPFPMSTIWTLFSSPVIWEVLSLNV
jgi:hypothetical protein